MKNKLLIYIIFILSFIMVSTGCILLLTNNNKVEEKETITIDQINSKETAQEYLESIIDKNKYSIQFENEIDTMITFSKVDKENNNIVSKYRVDIELKKVDESMPSAMSGY